MNTDRRCLVLVVEDDPSIAEFVQAALDDEGYEVIVAPSGEDALQRVAEQQPALILLDLILPGMSGGAFLQALRAGHPSGIPVVLMTAAREEPAQQGLQTEGMLPKPFELAALLAEVQRLTPEMCAGPSSRNVKRHA